MTYIIIIGIYQALCGLFFLSQLRKDKKSDNLLTYLIACIFIHLSIKLFLYNVLTTGTNNYDFVTFTDLAYGPLLYLYALKAKDDSYHLRKKLYLFLPAVLAAVAYSCIVTTIIAGYNNVGALINMYNVVMQFLIILFFVLFPLLVLNLAKDTSMFIRSELVFLKRIAGLFLFIAIVCIAGVSMIYFTDGGRNVVFALRGVVYTTLVIISFLILRFRFYAHVTIRENASGNADGAAIKPETEDRELSMPDNHDEDYIGMEVKSTRNAVLSETQHKTVVDKLTGLMEGNMIFTDNKLTLDKVSVLAKIPKHHISESLNHFLGKTFYEYINDYRINQVVALMEKCMQQDVVPNILSLAYDSGFNSKSTFNQYFKRIKGVTPSEYLKKFKPEVNI